MTVLSVFSFCAADGNWSVAKPSHQLIEIGTHGG
jgi:hypothetical protein